MNESNLELYRKYRPSSFDEVVGNEATIKSLKKEIENGSHVFLFTGPAGCGKTTLARIVAKEVGGGELSIKEINSAENRGIDTAKEVMQQMRYNSPDGSALVWIFDECHQWLAPVQNAFLKAFEDTPKHVYFFLCTTDPQKLIAPLKTRCSIISVKPLSDEEMKYLLKRTARAEKVKLSSDVYDRIVELADGGSRKALKLLNKVLYLDDDEERMEVLSVDDSEQSEEVKDLCKLLLNKDCTWSKLAPLLKTIQKTEDPERVRMAVMGYMNAVLLNGKQIPQAEACLQAFGNNNTFNNGKFQITIACLDYFDLLR